MNENINLCEILKGHEGETFYSPAYGQVCLSKVIQGGTIIVSASEYSSISMNPNGTLLFSAGECMIFPSKDQRDWNKWLEEQNPKVPKTWSDLERLDEITECGAEIVQTFNNRWWDSTKGNTPIEKSALALLKIHQLIEVGYGGNITNEEWKEHTKIKYTIDLKDKKLICSYTYLFKSHIAFHTKEQAEEFLKYSENVQLLKDYFMI